MPAASTTEELARRLLSGDNRALAQAITLLEDGDPVAAEVLNAVFPHSGNARVIGFTGPPGAGKSTLISAVVSALRSDDHTVAVLSVDPSSPFTHGALLGDRIRLADHFGDSGVYIRSMASRGALGGLAQSALPAALLMDAAGKDYVLLETVGVGQSEIDIIHHADTVILVLMPGSGDSVQALKAGVMEIPDVIVVNKCDLAGAELLRAEIRSVISPRRPASVSAGWTPPVIATDARQAVGVDELLATLGGHRQFLESQGQLDERRQRNLANSVVELAVGRFRKRLSVMLESDAHSMEKLNEVAARRMTPIHAAEALVVRLASEWRRTG
jgi:LAO/AO transport system kinase